MRYYVFSLILAILLAIGIGISAAKSRQSPSVLTAKTAITPLIPDGLTAHEESAPLHFYRLLDARRTLQGYLFLTHELAPEISGYNGPIPMAVCLDPKGTITRITLLAHHETSSYAQGLPDFIQRFIGMSPTAPRTLGREIDAITRATVSSRAVAESLNKSLSSFSKNVLNQQPAPKQDSTFYFQPFLFSLAALLLALGGLFWNNRHLRRASLVFSFLYFGIATAAIFCTAQIANILFHHIPSAASNPWWWITLVLALGTSIIVGRLYCSSLCPFAFIQEALRVISRRIAPQINPAPVSPADDTRARTGKYVILLALLSIALITQNTAPSEIEPYLTLFTSHGTPIAWILLGFVLLCGIFYFRFWCRYLCPAGALTGLLARFSVFRLTATNACTSCGLCRNTCPVNAIAGDARPTVESAECILCGQCQTTCPSNALSLQIRTSHNEQKPVAQRTRPNILFTGALLFSISLLCAVTVHAIYASQQKAAPTVPVNFEEEQRRTAAARERFNTLGLKLHEGKYWKEAPHE